MVNSVKSCCEIEEDEDGKMTNISREEDVVGDFEEGCFSAVFRTEARLKWFEQIICAEMGCELFSDSPFQYL